MQLGHSFWFRCCKKKLQNEFCVHTSEGFQSLRHIQGPLWALS